MKRAAVALFLISLGGTAACSASLVPAAGKLYPGFFFSAPIPGSDDATNTMSPPPMWPVTCAWIQAAGKVPDIRLMLRPDLDQNHAENTLSLANICAGRFDADLRRWAEKARDFGIRS